MRVRCNNILIIEFSFFDDTSLSVRQVHKYQKEIYEYSVGRGRG